MVKSCGIDIYDVYDVDSALSERIHKFDSRTVDAVRIYSKGLTDEYICLIEKIAEHYELKSEVIIAAPDEATTGETAD
jgi:hypothetical protein